MISLTIINEMNDRTAFAISQMAYLFMLGNRISQGKPL